MASLFSGKAMAAQQLYAPQLSSALSSKGYSIGSISPDRQVDFIQNNLLVDDGAILLTIPAAEPGEKIIDRALKLIPTISKPYFLFLVLRDAHDYDMARGTEGDKELILEYWSTMQKYKKHWASEEEALERRGELMSEAKAAYGRAVHYLDDQIGRLLDSCLDDKTIVIISSDHGERFDADTIRGILHSGSYHEELNHIPMVILDRSRKASIVTDRHQSTELLATIRAIIEGKPEEAPLL